MRQFFETRITRAGIPSPTYDIHIHTYTYTIRRLIHLLSCLAVKILHRLEEAMGLKRGVLVNLTDLHTHTQPCTRTPSPLSSYVLRICCYHTKPTKDGGGHTHTHTHGDVEGMVYTQDVCDGCKHDDHDGDGDGREMGGFGAHTDTSFLTLSPHSSLPGLDIYHPLKRVWQSVETHTYTHTPAHTDNQTQTQTHTDTNTRNMKHCVVVFTGELLQILTKHKVQYGMCMCFVWSMCFDMRVCVSKCMYMCVLVHMHIVHYSLLTIHFIFCTYIQLQACIHRVRIHPPHTHTHNYGDIRRISCPFIIRSYDTARLDLDMSGDDEYVYGDGDGNDVYSVGHGSEHSNEVVDDHSTSSGSHTHSTGAGWISRGLQDIDMFTIHKLLDLKRQKCFKQHEEDMGEWVLSAFGAKTS